MSLTISSSLWDPNQISPIALPVYVCKCSFGEGDDLRAVRYSLAAVSATLINPDPFYWRLLVDCFFLKFEMALDLCFVTASLLKGDKGHFNGFIIAM